MRTNFGTCIDCDRLACAHTDNNCCLRCPLCDWFICGECLRAHSKVCWDSDHIRVTKKPIFAGTEYIFEEQEPLKIKGVSAFAAEGLCRVVIENVEPSEHSK